MNKYPVFRNTYPTVIIESAVHEADLTEYTKEKARQVISFGLENGICWKEILVSAR